VPISHQNETTTGICLLHRHSRPPQNRLVEQKGISKYLSRYSYDPQKPEKTPLCGTGRSHQIKRISFFDTSLPVYLQLSKSHLCVPSKVPQHLQRCVSPLSLYIYSQKRITAFLLYVQKAVSSPATASINYKLYFHKDLFFFLHPISSTKRMSAHT
jgi:hypothetical protein